jgi:RNA polymerase sigma-70 factor (ECF subfamily)
VSGLDMPTRPDDLDVARHGSGGPPDEHLMRQFQRRLDGEAFERLVGRYAARALAAARQILADGAAAEDAVQETFLRVVRARGQYQVDRPFGVWFFAILRNVCRDVLRRRGLEVRAMAHLAVEREEASDPPSAPEDLRASGMRWHGLQARESWAGRERRLAAERCPWHDLLADLRPAERDALVLRVTQGLTLAEVGAALGISEEAAKKRVQRALGRLRRRWRRSRAAAPRRAPLAAR